MVGVHKVENFVGDVNVDGVGRKMMLFGDEAGHEVFCCHTPTTFGVFFKQVLQELIRFVVQEVSKTISFGFPTHCDDECQDDKNEQHDRGDEQNPKIGDGRRRVSGRVRLDNTSE